MNRQGSEGLVVDDEPNGGDKTITRVFQRVMGDRHRAGGGGGDDEDAPKKDDNFVVPIGLHKPEHHVRPSRTPQHSYNDEFHNRFVSMDSGADVTSTRSLRCHRRRS